MPMNAKTKTALIAAVTPSVTASTAVFGATNASKMVKKAMGTVLSVSPLIMTISLMLLLPGAMAQVVPGAEDMRQEPVTVNEHLKHYEILTPEIEKQFDDLMHAIHEIQLQNYQLNKSPNNEQIRDIMEHNNNIIDKLLIKIDEVYPPIPVVEVTEVDEKRMRDAMFRLVDSGLPLLGMWIEPSTGLLAIEVNINEAGPDIKESIRNFTHDIPLNI